MVAEMSFLHRVAGHTLCGRVRTLTIQESLGIDLLLLQIKIEMVHDAP